MLPITRSAHVCLEPGPRSFSILAHISGVSVNDTRPEAKIATMIVIANSRKMRPTRPDMEDTPRLMILAPVVAARKGEQADLLEELRAQGFTRVRIDGRVHELDSAPRLARNAKHSIDVVVDRVKARADAKQRLAESLETALRHADGKAVVQETDNRKEHLFSAKFACPRCDYAISELEPRLFSFNNPLGACPRCDGLGSIEFFDPKRIVAHPNLSLAAGAIRG